MAKKILSSDKIRRVITRLASQVIEKSGDLSDIILLGIHTRGVPLAYMLAQQIELLEGVQVPIGAIDVTFYRDDLDRIKTRTPAKTKVPVDLTGKTVILVDDVIYKGRTIRLLVLVDRGHRELPIHPDFTGKKLPTSSDEQVKVYLQETDGRDAVELLNG